MKTLIKIAFVLIGCQLLLMSTQLNAEEKHERESCRVCGMWIDEYIKSAAELTYKDGHKQYTCGVACMLREIDDAGGLSAFESAKVHDWVSGELVDAEDATYVLGSKVIPDMVPNYIAFANRDEAEAFAAKEGGDVIDFHIAYEDVSPVGTTAPFRLRTAVTPGKGNFSVGMVYGYTQKDRVKIGSGSSQEPYDFVKGNRAQPRAPSQLEAHQQALTANYSPTDDIALFINVPWLERRTKTLNQTPAGVITESVGEENGIGDITLEGRYNFWRSNRWDKFATVLLGTTLPTGQFSADRQPALNTPPAQFIARQTGDNLISTSPALQLGKDTATFTGGLLYSQRWKALWLHTTALYTVNPKNDENFAFGDVANIGLGLHYTPNYDLMLGVEIDASYIEKNEDRGYKIGNSGGTVTNLAFVSDWRFMNAFGGNFKLRGSVGLPIYEDLNSREIVNRAGQTFTQVQLGDGFFGNLALVWTFRAAPDY
ncbi:nitrous oxide reductase accessory protein NosL [Methylicorpusculum oleiharenae]|uniref:nitrous oxide reductase accessory protein NosL n=1 Tax=Methylicorpusculum oleiharenae TaxID=1338687 RepID=UPI00135CF27C|nr:nitrous oxide reductase accessory protein NosL [Methylicorpusculum oleiharenae]MCD2450592.1 nitrous oxide reductase accessory protein NosL [Methylicorpusculum oleiharenae]